MRNLPRVKSISLRSYCMSTSWRSDCCRGVRSAPFLRLTHEAVVFLRLAQAVDAGDRGHDEHIAALEEGAGGGVAQLIYLLVDVRVFLDVGVGAGDIGLRLVVVVVADEVLHGVVGEELLELGVELGGQRLVVADDQGGALHPLDDVGHGEGLAAAGDAQQGLVLIALLQPLHQLIHRLGLVAGHPKSETILKAGMIILSLGLKTIHNHCITLGFCRQSAMSLKSWFRICGLSGA